MEGEEGPYSFTKRDEEGHNLPLTPVGCSRVSTEVWLSSLHRNQSTILHWRHDDMSRIVMIVGSRLCHQATDIKSNIKLTDGRRHSDCEVKRTQQRRGNSH